MSSVRGLVVRVARLTLYVAVVSAVSLFAGTRLVRAQVSDAALGIGERLLAMDGLGESIVVNDQALRVATVTTELDYVRVLDILQRACEEHADDVPAVVASLGSPTRSDLRGAPGLGVLRDERDDRGVVACFAPGREVSAGEYLAKLGRLARSHDLGALGKMRYVTVAKAPSGGSRVVATFAEGPLWLDALFPSSGDAPGTDPTRAARPDSARRLMSVRAGSSGDALYLYETKQPLGAALDAYAEAMRARGFTSIPSVARSGRDSRAFRTATEDVLAHAAPGDRATFLSIVETSAGEGTR